MSVLTLRMLEELARDELGTTPGGSTETREFANKAGNHLMGAREWNWAEGRSATLRPRPSITITDALWTEATKTITETGAFVAPYVLLSADTAEVTAGTGATTGTYEVATNPTTATITLTTSIGAAANGQTDIDLFLPNDQILLPSDFDLYGITAYAMADGLLGYPQFTNPQTMLNLRSWRGVGTTVGFWALLRHVRSTSGGQPVPRLELWPRTEESDEALVIYYRSGWKEPATDDEVLSIPGWLNDLYVEMFKAAVMGSEEPEHGTVDARLSALRGGVLYRDAAMRDATMQRDLGRMENGWLETVGPYGRYDVPPPLINVP